VRTAAALELTEVVIEGTCRAEHMRLAGACNEERGISRDTIARISARDEALRLVKEDPTVRQDAGLVRHERYRLATLTVDCGDELLCSLESFVELHSGTSR
jgi:hypothetical protein